MGRILLFGCAAADALAAPAAPLPALAEALAAAGHDVLLVWHALRWRGDGGLGDEPVAGGARAVLRWTTRPDELDPCAYADAVRAEVRGVLADALLAGRPDALVIGARDAFAIDLLPPHPHPCALVVGPHAVTAAAVGQRLTAAAAAVAAWRARLDRPRAAALRFEPGGAR